MKYVIFTLFVVLIISLESRVIKPFFQKLSDKIVAIFGYNNFQISKLVLQVGLLSEFVFVYKKGQLIIATTLFIVYFFQYIGSIIFIDQLERFTQNNLNVIPLDVFLARLVLNSLKYLNYCAIYFGFIISGKLAFNLMPFIVVVAGYYFALCVSFPKKDQVSLLDKIKERLRFRKMVPIMDN